MIEVIQKIFLCYWFFYATSLLFFVVVVYSLSSIGRIRRNNGKEGGKSTIFTNTLKHEHASSPWVGLKLLSIRSTLQSAGREVYIASFQVTKTDKCFSYPKRAMKTSLVEEAAHLVFSGFLKRNLRENFCCGTDNETLINKLIPASCCAVVLNRYLGFRI